MTLAVLSFTIPDEEVDLRQLTLLAVLCTTGCFSNWNPNDERFPNPYVITPHWPDCDGDGWGDPRLVEELGTDGNPEFSFLPPDCIVLGVDDNPDCDGDGEADDGVDWVKNDLDCDDAYADSGARLGGACPEEFSSVLGVDLDSDDYTTFAIGDREYLLITGTPMASGTAERICQDWWADPARVQDDDFGYGDNTLGGLASLDGQFEPGQFAGAGQVSDAIQEWFDGHAGSGHLWVGGLLMNPDATLDQSPVFMWAEPDGEDGQIRPEGVPFCSQSPGSLQDIYEIYTEFPGSAGESVVDQFAGVRLVIDYSRPVGGPCLELPRRAMCDDPSTPGARIPCCADGEDCTYDVLCERHRTPDVGCVPDLEDPLANSDCPNVLAVGDLQCTAP